MTKWKKLLALLLALVMVLSLAACGGTTSGETDADADNAAAEESGSDTGTDAEGETADTSVLHVALTNSFTGGSAINTADPYRYSTLNQVYETLLCYADGEYYGDLAESWEQTEPGVWSIQLYEGITDSEGNPFTADDVAWAFDAQKDAGFTEATYYDKGAVEVVDDTHLTFTMNTDSEGAFYTIATKMLLCTQEAYDASSDHLATQPVGTGPYVVTSLTEGSSCTLTKRNDYWQTGEIAPSMVANYDTIEISYVSEATQMAITIESGNVQFAGQVDMSISGQADAVDAIHCDYVSNGTYNGLGFNMNNDLVGNNLALREAICYAIDPQGLIDSVYSGHGTVMTNYGMPTAVDYDESWTCPISYDPETAQAKLAEAGYADGVTITLLANNVGEDAQIAELIQGYLSMVGITVELDYVDPATQTARIAEGNWDICLVGGMGVADMFLFWGNLYARQSNGMSMYFHNDEALYDIYDNFAAAGGKTTENLQALYEYESSHITWFPMFNKQVLYAIDDQYGDILYNELYMSLPYVGTLTPNA